MRDPPLWAFKWLSITHKAVCTASGSGSNFPSSLISNPSPALSSPSQVPALFLPFKLILHDALTKYQKKTKKNLLEYWLATELKSCESTNAVLGILQDQVKAVEGTSAADQKLMKHIGSLVNILTLISDALSRGISLAFPPAKVIFSEISVLVSVAKGVKACHDALADLYGRIKDFFKHFKVYMESSPTTELLEVLVKVVVEILSILSIATQAMEQSLTKKFLKQLVGRTDIEEGLKKLDKLIQGEHGMAMAQVLKATTEIKDDVKELVLTIEQMSKKAGQDKSGDLQWSAQQNVQGILSKLPKTLDETYEHVLRDIQEDNKEHACRLLHCLAFAVQPLRVMELAEILAFEFDTAEGDILEYHTDWRWKDQEEAILSMCSSLITVAKYNGNNSHSRKQVVQFSHVSVKEFLMLNRLTTPIRDVSLYHILPESAHTILTQACYGFLLHLNDPIWAAKNYPLADYVA
ncbi:hypothetical protein EI94DRAFT_1803580 [Lactarius quietus]|nr:hypothetical protein EI94DRAFT_1803580 [Lactarius quietus]